MMVENLKIGPIVGTKIILYQSKVVFIIVETNIIQIAFVAVFDPDSYTIMNLKAIKQQL